MIVIYVVNSLLLLGAMILVFLAHRRLDILEKKVCPCPICQHVSTLSDEALKDIIDKALVESHE